MLVVLFDIEQFPELPYGTQQLEVLRVKLVDLLQQGEKLVQAALSGIDFFQGALHIIIAGILTERLAQTFQGLGVLPQAVVAKALLFQVIGVIWLQP